MDEDVPELVGLVVAAGAGRRFGGPKVLARTSSGEPWVARAVDLLRGAGCSAVVVVVGAEPDAARAILPAGVVTVVADRWREGMGASLDAGVAALPEADAVLILPVDLPRMPASVPARLLGEGTARDVLARAVFAGEPGHPVLLGHDHWSAFRDGLSGDEGGRRYLERHGVVHVECGDLFDGRDRDHR